jgi:hypothetical protein
MVEREAYHYTEQTLRAERKDLGSFNGGDRKIQNSKFKK